MSEAPRQFTVEHSESGRTLAALARQHGLAASWSEARRLATTGKLFVDGAPLLDPVARPPAGTVVELRMRAPRAFARPPGEIVFDDSQVVVFDKPAGVSSVPYEERESNTAMDLIRGHWRARGGRATETPLHVVHRIDKDTSGLIVFAKTKGAERALAALFRSHEIERTYLCVVHGTINDRRIESRLVEDRGDGLRGATRREGQGKRAVTHVHALAPAGPHATLCEVRLETGKTHQIRIHLAENGYPLVGERVYIRDYTARGHEPLPSPRLLLHAATLGFPHPVSGEPLRFESAPPPDFDRALRALSRVP